MITGNFLGETITLADGILDILWSPTVREWASLIVRWTHVFAAIMWVGSTYYFTWLDGRLSEEEKAAGGNKAQVWMVHSGGFYVVEKQKKPGTQKLHWFRWEAAVTWLSGITLLALVYYLPSGLTDPDVLDISHGTAVLVGLGVIVVGWVVYDLLSQSPIGKNELAFAAVSYVLVVALTYGLTRVLSARAAYIHVGALFGTIMAANVWMRILPAQRQTIAATSEGKQPDARLAARAKLRSKHNTFIVVPTVFIMISNHYAVASYGSRYGWIILAVLILLGWGAAKIIRRA
ncbi:MAG TPA: urate hydroxylase PuuD [Pyrinomonadaceae bacterium]|nr:urate hydroxylase PuuD [Pyrinomonadaceae bacterium]